MSFVWSCARRSDAASMTPGSRWSPYIGTICWRHGDGFMAELTKQQFDAATACGEA